MPKPQKVGGEPFVPRIGGVTINRGGKVLDRIINRYLRTIICCLE